VVVSRRRGLRLRTQVGDVLPHPSLRLRRPAPPAVPELAPVAGPPLVSEQRRAS
jgi:hypothetical protein